MPVGPKTAKSQLLFSIEDDGTYKVSFVLQPGAARPDLGSQGPPEGGAPRRGSRP